MGFGVRGVGCGVSASCFSAFSPYLSAWFPRHQDESQRFKGVPSSSCALRNVQWFRGGLVFEAHRLLYHSAQGSKTYTTCNEKLWASRVSSEVNKEVKEEEVTRVKKSATMPPARASPSRVVFRSLELAGRCFPLLRVSRLQLAPVNTSRAEMSTAEPRGIFYPWLNISALSTCIRVCPRGNMRSKVFGGVPRPRCGVCVWDGGIDLSSVSSAATPAGWRSSNFASQLRACAPRCAVFARFSADMILFFARSSLPELPGADGAGGAAPSGVEGGDSDARSMLPGMPLAASRTATDALLLYPPSFFSDRKRLCSVSNQRGTLSGRIRRMMEKSGHRFHWCPSLIRFLWI